MDSLKCIKTVITYNVKLHSCLATLLCELIQCKSQFVIYTQNLQDYNERI